MSSDEAIASIASSLELLAKVSVLRLVDGRDKAEAMALLAGLGFKHTEIGEMLGIKPKTVTAALRRARQRSEATE